MRNLRIVVTTADAERFRGALMLAAAQAALGGEAAIFLQLDAVTLLRTPVRAPQDAAHARAGMPALATLLTETLALDVRVTACQSGLALAGLSAEALPDGVEAGGPVAFLQATGDEARLLIV